MDKKSIMNNFRKYMAKANKGMFGWLVMWITGLLTMILANGNAEKYTHEDLSELNTILVVLLITVSVIAYIDKYVKVFFTDAKIKDAEDVAMLKIENFGEMMKSHGFDRAVYFGILVKRFIPVQLVSAACIMAVGAFDIIIMKNALIFTGIVIVVPEVIFAVRYLVTSYVCTHKVGILFNIFIGLVNGILSFARIFSVGCAFILLCFLALSLTGISKQLSGFDSNDVVRFSSGTGFILGALIIAVLILSEMITDTDKEMIFMRGAKNRKYVVAVVAALTVGLFIAFNYFTLHNNVKLTENTITVSEDGKTKEYSIDDITAYEVYGSDGIKMKVTFTDGCVTDIFRNSTDETDGWSSRYYSDYNYAAELAEKLSDRGVRGTLGDLHDLDETVQGLDQQCIDGYNKLMAIVAN